MWIFRRKIGLANGVEIRYNKENIIIRKVCFVCSPERQASKPGGERDMKQKLKIVCAVLAAMVIVSCHVFPTWAMEAVGETGSVVVEETTLVETVEATEAAETVPAENAQETVPVETAEPAESTAAEELPAAGAEEQAEAPAASIEVPLFYQTDYPDTLYSKGTIETDGCSITSLAMVATYMTGHPYLPDELAGYFGGYLGEATNNVERLEAASTALQLPWERAENFHVALKALREGKVVIALMNKKSIFTDSQHFIVLAGMTQDGKILVNDPYEPNYSRWELQKAFRYGFDEGDISCGFSGAWIYDKSAMPEEPFLYTEEKVVVEPRYTDIELTDAEKTLLAKMVWVEAQGETFEGQQAIAEVVLNRVAADGFQKTVRGVIYADGQFKSAKLLKDVQPTQTQYEAVEAALNGPYVLPKEVVYFATYPVTKNVWGTIGGHVFCYQN